ncbi:hypothetical protein C7C46_17785 [Streptomyces tateyamensis]|uniref:DUF3344 domain-containing protein n=1 Tax=Streptomyces tateyamensis TaxID=565073 RepID=A0A2V4N4L7_9ACTN|nr:hypothetical protein [Streptomyces tateyamensis]PYC77823.1 hypothetical protein C7C46_17785 [Streptomyces tateyamensis]
MSTTAGRATRARTLVRRCAVAIAATTAAAAQFLFIPAAGALPAAAPERGSAGAEHRDDPNAPVLSEHPIPFTTRFQADMQGNITRIGNTLLTCDETKAPVKAGTAPCTDARNGVGPNIFDNNYQMRYVNIEPPGRKGPLGDDIYSSSSASLTLPDSATVKFARLYWGATRGIGKTVLPITQVDEVYFKAPGDSEFRDIAAQGDIGQINTTQETAYQASADVTDIVKAAGGGTYEVADLDTVIAPHSWGSWTLVVATEDCNQPMRHLQVWDGFQVELPNSPAIDIDVNGFHTPAKDKLFAKLGYVGYDGDRTYTGDTLSIKTTNGPETQISDDRHPANDIMNSTISSPFASDQFTRNPNYDNTFGQDLAVFDVSKLMRAGDTNLRMRFNTTLDGYQLGAAFVAINLDDSADSG